MVYKNTSADMLQSVMRVRFWLDYVALTKFFLTGHPANAKAAIQARKAFKTLKKEYAPVREENLSKTAVSSIPEMFRKSLIITFYLKGRRTFADFCGYEL